MKRLARCLAGILMTSIPIVHTYSQSAVVAAGGDAIGPNGTVAYSVGQLDYDYYTGVTGTIQLGVQQPDVVIIIGTNELADQFEIKLFPNPVGDETNLIMEKESYMNLNQNLRYELFDLSGRMLLRNNINGTSTIVKTDMLTNGEYVLRIVSENQHLKTFKIVKSN